MTAEEFAAKVEKLITDAREAGLSDEEIIAELHGIVAAKQDGLS